MLFSLHLFIRRHSRSYFLNVPHPDHTHFRSGAIVCGCVVFTHSSLDHRGYDISPVITRVQWVVFSCKCEEMPLLLCIRSLYSQSCFVALGGGVLTIWEVKILLSNQMVMAFFLFIHQNLFGIFFMLYWASLHAHGVAELGSLLLFQICCLRGKMFFLWCFFFTPSCESSTLLKWKLLHKFVSLACKYTK